MAATSIGMMGLGLLLGSPGIFGVYGPDDRTDLVNVTNPQQLELAHSTVALIYHSDLETQPDGQVKLLGASYGEENRLCREERFWEQKSAAYCSGVLVAPDIVLTAGHCITDELICSQTAFVFGYAIENSGDRAETVPAENIYRCNHIIHREDQKARVDFALVQLDRPVAGREPVPYREAGEIDPLTSVLVIGHPSGLPAKLAAGAQVRRVMQNYFTANLDTFYNNSGSPVFNLETGLLEGLLVQGGGDFEWKGPGQGCKVVKRCPDQGCRGEDVIKIEIPRRYLSGG
jgi:hypothetical protein